MYCSNCGKKVDEKAVVCIGCGCTIVNNNVKKAGNGKGIASMILGIFGLFYVLAAFLNFSHLGDYLDFQTGSYKIGFAIGFILIQTVCAIISLCLSLSDRKAKKTSFNTAGFFLSLATLALAMIQFIYIITFQS